MHMPGDRHDVIGVYREIVPNQKLVLHLGLEVARRSATRWSRSRSSQMATGTMLTLLHEHFFDADARDRHQHGWAGAIDKLEKLFA